MDDDKTKENKNTYGIQSAEIDAFDIDNDDSQILEPYRPLNKHLVNNNSKINCFNDRDDQCVRKITFKSTVENGTGSCIIDEGIQGKSSCLKTRGQDTFDIDNDDSQELEPYKPLSKKLKSDNDLMSKAVHTENSTPANTTEIESFCGRLTPSIEQDLSCDSFNTFKKLDSIINSSTNIENRDPFDLLSDEDKEKVDGYKPLQRKTNLNFSSFGKAIHVNERPDSFENKISKADFSEHSSDSLCDNVKSSQKPTVVYVYSDELKQETSKLFRIENRAELTHSLIETYGLLNYVQVVTPRPATEAEIVGFHCPQYIQCLQKCGSFVDVDDLPESLSEEAEGYGLSYDCPQQAGIFEAASLISGASITGAQSLVDGTGDIAINWCGGWHHAKRDSASGFCYINDIVLSILKLKEKYDRVLYVDLDLHHGDGVEEAFEMTPTVMTVSFHKYDSGFFPGSGCISDVGSGRGKFHSVNVPLKDGIKDAEFFAVFMRVMKQVKATFAPLALVLQCGADGLGADPMAAFNLTHVGLARCVCFCLAWRLPTLMLGGGGYDFPTTAKTWTFLTAVAAGRKLPTDIPEHEHLLQYGPGYELTTEVSNRRDLNTPQSLAQVIHTVKQNLGNIKQEETAKKSSQACTTDS